MPNLQHGHEGRPAPVGNLSRKLPKFDGTSRWETFYSKFINFKVAYGWSDREAASRLAEALESGAADLYAVLPQDVRDDFTRLTQKFKCAYGVTDNLAVLRVKLREEVQSSQESLKEFARRVSQLSYRAYPDDGRKAEDEGAYTLLKGCRCREGALHISLQSDDTQL